MILSRCLRPAVVLVMVLVLSAPALRARPAINELADALLLNEVADVLRQEGIRYGQDLDRDFLGGRGGTFFAEEVARIYDTSAMLRVLKDNLNARMSESDIAESLMFFDTERGRAILRLEVSARRAMADSAVEDLAKTSYAAAVEDGHGKLDAVRRFIDINDLTERNVAGALSSSYQFFLGLADGGSNNMTDGDITGQIWRQEQEIRADIAQWLGSYLFMAHAPLSDADMQAYLAFSGTSAGQSMNAALFDGFDEMYRTIYYSLGVAVARSLHASDL